VVNLFTLNVRWSIIIKYFHFLLYFYVAYCIDESFRLSTKWQLNDQTASSDQRICLFGWCLAISAITRLRLHNAAVGKERCERAGLFWDSFDLWFSCLNLLDSDNSLYFAFVEFPRGCDSYYGPHTMQCLRSLWSKSECLNQGWFQPDNITYEKQLWNKLNLRYDSARLSMYIWVKSYN